MSKDSGMAIDDITKAAVLFFQQGLNTDEVLEMTEVTAQFAKGSRSRCHKSGRPINSSRKWLLFSSRRCFFSSRQI